jgi:zinc protease
MTATRAVFAMGIAILASIAPVRAGEALPIETLETMQGQPFWYLPTDKPRRTAITVLWPSDLAIVPEGKEGVALLATKLMMSGGAGGLAPGELIARFDDLDAIARIEADAHEVRAVVAAPQDSALEAAGYLNMALTRPALGEDWLARVRRHLLTEVGEKHGQIQSKLLRTARRAVMGASRYARALSIEPDSVLGSVTRADVVAWHKAAFARENAIVVVTGSAGPDDARRLVDRVLEGLPGKSAAASAPFPRLRVTGRTIVLNDPSAEKSAVLLVGTVPPATDRLGLETMLASRALGGSSQARLFRAVRSELGATYRIAASTIDFAREQRLLSISAEIETDKLGPAIAAIRQTYRRFRAEGVGDEEFAALREHAVRDFAELLQKPMPLSRTLIDAQASGHDAGYVAGIRSRLAAMERGALNEHIARRFPALDDILTIIVTPRPPEGLDADCVIAAPEEVEGCL